MLGALNPTDRAAVDDDDREVYRILFFISLRNIDRQIGISTKMSLLNISHYLNEYLFHSRKKNKSFYIHNIYFVNNNNRVYLQGFVNVLGFMFYLFSLNY